MPKNKCNDCELVSTAVKIRQGDLMLCEACNIIRFPPSGTKKTCMPANDETNPKSVVSPSHRAENHKNDNPVMVQNELLAYILYYYSCSSIECIKKSVLSFYTPEEIFEAKEQLWATNDGKINCSKHRRISTSTRAAHEADLNDIISVISDLDRQGDIYLGKYYAVNIGRIPKCAPEEYNTFAMIDRMHAVEIQIAEIKELAMNNCSKISSNTMKMTDFDVKITDNKTDIKRMEGHIQSMKVSVDNMRPSYSSMLSKPDMGNENNTVMSAVFESKTAPPSNAASLITSNNGNSNFSSDARQHINEHRSQESVIHQSTNLQPRYQFNKIN